MKKDEEWLKEEVINKITSYLGSTSKRSELINLIDQLDEPEITEEQAWNKIAESYPADARSLVTSFQHFYYGDFIKNPTISKKETVKIPQFVDKWVRSFDLEGGSKWNLLGVVTNMTSANVSKVDADIFNWFLNIFKISS